MLENLWNHATWPQYPVTVSQVWWDFSVLAVSFLSFKSFYSIASAKILKPYPSLHNPNSSLPLYTSHPPLNFLPLLAIDYSMRPPYLYPLYSNPKGLIISLKINPLKCSPIQFLSSQETLHYQLLALSWIIIYSFFFFFFLLDPILSQ